MSPRPRAGVAQGITLIGAIFAGERPMRFLFGSWLVPVCLLCGGVAFGQQDSSGVLIQNSPKTIAVSQDSTADWRLRHQPVRAAVYSALLPGAGQIYNRKYWKAPIVWGGLALSLYFAQNNTKEYVRYRDAYVAIVDGDPNTVDEFHGAYSADAVRSVADTYHKWRDLSYFATAAVYLLNIVDASVDAHFVRFDVSNDLTLEVGPSPAMAAQGAVGLSLSLHL